MFPANAVRWSDCECEDFPCCGHFDTGIHDPYWCDRCGTEHSPELDCDRLGDDEDEEVEPRCDVCNAFADDVEWCGVCGCCVEHCQRYDGCEESRA